MGGRDSVRAVMFWVVDNALVAILSTPVRKNKKAKRLFS